VRFVDSHLHLCEYVDPASTIDSARETQTLLLSSAVDRLTSASTNLLASSAPGQVLSFVGLHPSEAEKDLALDWFDAALGAADGAGELGLDPRYSSTARDGAQMRHFKRQLEVAEKEDKPVQVHSRGAERECLEVLDGFSLRSVLMHWFEDEGAMGSVVARGYYVSFGPAVLHSKKIQRMASAIDRSLVLTESDGPVSFKPLGGADGPVLVPSVVYRLAELWQVPFDDARDEVLDNSLRYLRRPGKG
jgi:TatD DNase family protein